MHKRSNGHWPNAARHRCQGRCHLGDFPERHVPNQTPTAAFAAAAAAAIEALSLLPVLVPLRMRAQLRSMMVVPGLLLRRRLILLPRVLLRWLLRGRQHIDADIQHDRARLDPVGPACGMPVLSAHASF